jgi:transcriptional regulator GlxA family with amidase domain
VFVFPSFPFHHLFVVHADADVYVDELCEGYVLMCEKINPTHTYANPPTSIDVLLVPGGAGARLLNVSTQIDFVRKTYPNVKYLISICTGAGIVARAGVLDGREATTNKKAWATVTNMRKEVVWRSPARWVVDGNIWSSSGVTAGLDLIFAFIEEVYGEDAARELQGTLEYERGRGMCDDVFAEVHGVVPTWECVERKGNRTMAL